MVHTDMYSCVMIGPRSIFFQAFCRQTGNELVEHTQDGSVYRFLIKHTAA